MERLELSELALLLREAAGEDEGAVLDEDTLDTLFLDLGYDSLALLQVTGVVERDHDLMLDEEALAEAQTPRQYLDLVNGALAARAAA
ncbi:actinorhodin polyketide synthase [Streptomyces cellostaticus]|uniref:Actinorhodin polyketide synthase n=1 Tax=Streptomyces cellostaticus TaxID=67285 RepID=A0A101N5J8_9ACTN|nr:acyl carrier protein [Streptomyces cellostaticus]KUM86956.1 actinorhodin polyketide synthase [Streptomyces cellostaticus]GHI10378.1 actinorhodin polyketide synthase acyl carrier protein [Streptomyces cellostaticus]